MNEVHPSIREIAVLQEATEMILSSSDLDTVLHQILLIVRNYFGTANCAVFLADDSVGQLVLRAENGLGGQRTRHTYKIGEEGVVGWVGKTGAPLYVPDVSKDARYLADVQGIRSELALPFLVRDRVVGVLDVESEKLDYFSDEIIGLLALFAGQAAVAIENARLYSTERRRMRQVEVIHLIARSSTAAADLNEFVAMLAELTADTFENSEVTVLLRDDSGSLAVRAHAGSSYPFPDAVLGSQRNGILAQTLSTRTSVLVNDISVRLNWTGLLGSEGAELCVPLVSFGDVIGAIVIATPTPHGFAEEDRSIAQASADVCATAIRNVQLSEELRRVTSTDALTGVYNQRHFLKAVGQEIVRARRYRKRFSLVMFDLCRFRGVNEQLGFDAGDDLLRRIAHLISTQVRAIDTLARYAGDRFAVVLPETAADHIPAVQAKVSELVSEISLPPGMSGKLRAVSACVHYPDDGDEEVALVQRLLQRLAAAKQQANSAAAGPA